MTRKRICTTCIAALLAALPVTVQAQAADDGLPPAPPEAAPASDKELKAKKSDVAPAAPDPKTKKLGKKQMSWDDIVVMPRKVFIKKGRFEVSPYIGSTINDNLIQHTLIGAEVNYFLTVILSIGINANYYIGSVSDAEFATRYQFGRVPSLNRYHFHASLNFAYVPFYGKFALFNNKIFHYEVFPSGGVGITGTEIIPRRFSHDSFSSIALTFPIGLGARIFINRWLSAFVTVRDHMMIDRFEPTGRSATKWEGSGERADTRFINNVVMPFGVGFFFPMDFKYTTFR